MKIIKRDGREVNFDRARIQNAIQAAANEVEPILRPSPTAVALMLETIESQCKSLPHIPHVEDIQDMVEDLLLKSSHFEVAKRYIRYRHERNLRRRKNTTDDRILSLIDYDNEEVKQENSNKNPQLIPTQRDYIAGEVSKDISRRMLIPEDIITANDEGIIHFHDMDYFIHPMYNCCLVNLKDMLTNGTVISETKIDPPHAFSTACTIATQIAAQVASNQYGGQTMTLAHLSPFVNKTRQRLYQRYAQYRETMSEIDFDTLIDQMVQDDIVKGIQTLQYQIVTLMTTNGQSPFITLYLDINEVPEGSARDDLARCIAEVLRQRTQGVKNKVGVWVTPAFPKLIYALDENNVRPGSEYYWLTELAAQCTAKRMVPDYISSKLMRELKEGNVFPCMGCRSFLSAWQHPPLYGDYKFYGRFNQGVVTINLPDVALSSGKDFQVFWKIFDERLELCHRALLLRHEHLEGTKSDVAPILWQHGAIARLQPGETIDPLLHGGYATISLGYAGLCECVHYMTGKSHTDPGATPLALAIMDHMNEKLKEWNEQHHIGFALYGTPIESTTYKFAKCLQKRFGIIEGVTDKNYITNSYHVHVTEPIDAFTKLNFESQFQELSTGGAISYVEVPNMTTNIPAVLSVIEHIYDHIMYAELNTKSDYCQVCGFDGEIKVVKNADGKLVWQCPKCGCEDQTKMNIARRVCGYISTNQFNQGRTQEIAERVLHL